VNFEIVKIEDEVDVAGEDAGLEAIVVSEETERNAGKVNEVRRKNGLRELEVIVIPLVRDAGGRKLSCRGRIRG